MPARIDDPADTPAEVYHHWHRRWCEILTEESREAFVTTGLTGMSFTERVPDAPDGLGYFSYAFDGQGCLGFMEGQGRAVAEYDSYELGLRLLTDASMDGHAAIEGGRFRIISEPEHWGALMSLLPLLRAASHRAIEEAEAEFGLVLPKYW